MHFTSVAEDLDGQDERTVGSHCLSTIYFHPLEDKSPGERLPALHTKDMGSNLSITVYHSF